MDSTLPSGSRVQAPALIITNQIARIYRRSMGRGPTVVRTVIGDDRVVCCLDGVMTTAERTLHAHGRVALVAAQRRQLHESLKALKIEVVERALERSVICAMASIDPECDLSVEIFVLAPNRP